MKQHLKLALIFIMLCTLVGVANGQNLQKEDIQTKPSEDLNIDSNTTKLSQNQQKRKKKQEEDLSQSVIEYPLPARQNNGSLNINKNSLREQDDLTQFVLDVGKLCPDFDFKTEDAKRLAPSEVFILNKMILLIKDKESILEKSYDFTCKEYDQFTNEVNALHRSAAVLPENYILFKSDAKCLIQPKALTDVQNIIANKILKGYFDSSFRLLSEEEFNFAFKGQGVEFCKNNDKSFLASLVFLKLVFRLSAVVLALEASKPQANRIVRTAEKISKCYTALTDSIRGFVNREGNGARLPEA